jgi:hypothetical protein
MRFLEYLALVALYEPHLGGFNDHHISRSATRWCM